MKPDAFVRTGMLYPVRWSRIDAANEIRRWRRHGRVKRWCGATERAYFCDHSSRIVIVKGEAT